jgi:hypothetical protein
MGALYHHENCLDGCPIGTGQPVLKGGPLVPCELTSIEGGI